MPPLALVDGLDDWVLMVIGAGLFLLVLLAVVLAIRARKASLGPGAAPAPDEATWGSALSDPLPEPAVAGEVSVEGGAWPEPMPEQPLSDGTETAPPAAGQVHYCRCPACQTQFTVNGLKPIVTNCPGCGKKGYLR